MPYDHLLPGIFLTVYSTVCKLFYILGFFSRITGPIKDADYIYKYAYIFFFVSLKKFTRSKLVKEGWKKGTVLCDKECECMHKIYTCRFKI